MKLLKEQLENVYTNLIYKYIDTILPEVIDSSLKEKYIDDFTKYYKGNYRKSMIENVEIKIVVKDTTLINGVKEQGERYLFTLENSRIFQDLDEDA